jgi:hypothetical protein
MLSQICAEVLNDKKSSRKFARAFLTIQNAPAELQTLFEFKT